MLLLRTGISAEKVLPITLGFEKLKKNICQNYISEIVSQLIVNSPQKK